MNYYSDGWSVGEQRKSLEVSSKSPSFSLLLYHLSVSHFLTAGLQRMSNQQLLSAIILIFLLIINYSEALYML